MNKYAMPKHEGMKKPIYKKEYSYNNFNLE